MSISDSVLIGNSAPMQQVKRLIQLVARSNASVLILGESGTGKELVAQAIHQESPRSNFAYVPVNCGAIPAELLGSELFGHEKGAFSGASSAHKGRFELADHGTLLLNEIGEMPLSMQVKLQRVLQEHVIDRVGSEKPRALDVRIIAATHQNLADKVAGRDFREDLYHQLNAFTIQMPPLRDRGADILLLWDYFSKDLCFGDEPSVSLSAAAAHEIMQREWKGNCRELRNLVERMSLLHPGAEISLQQIQLSSHILVSDMIAIEGQDELSLQLQTPVVAVPEDTEQLADVLVSGIDIIQGCDLKQQLIAVETRLIQKALNATFGNVSKASDLLSVKRTTLIEKIKKYQLLETG